VGQLFLVTGDLNEAKEVVQEAFTRAAVHWQRLGDYDVPELWVRRVAINLATDRVRWARRWLTGLGVLAAVAVGLTASGPIARWGPEVVSCSAYKRGAEEVQRRLQVTIVP
jgi:RNA polymerase sigma-70 factor, ECF subfamily